MPTAVRTAVTLTTTTSGSSHLTALAIFNVIVRRRGKFLPVFDGFDGTRDVGKSGGQHRCRKKPWFAGAIALAAALMSAREK